MQRATAASREREMHLYAKVIYSRSGGLLVPVQRLQLGCTNTTSCDVFLAGKIAFGENKKT